MDILSLGFQKFIFQSHVQVFLYIAINRNTIVNSWEWEWEEEFSLMILCLAVEDTKDNSNIVQTHETSYFEGKCILSGNMYLNTFGNRYSLGLKISL